MKYCKRCNSEKDKSLFSKNKSMRDGLQSYCKACLSSHYPQSPKQNREAKILDRYGINEAQYQWLLASQGGCCKICFSTPGTKQLSIDHSHDTGEVRGLLCGQCNFMLGCAKDSAWILRAGSDYLEQSVLRWD
jgi:hypothetical protein